MTTEDKVIQVINELYMSLDKETNLENVVFDALKLGVNAKKTKAVLKKLQKEGVIETNMGLFVDADKTYIRIK